VRQLLSRRDVRLLLAGQSLSMFGDWAMFIALGIWAKVLTGSNAAANEVQGRVAAAANMVFSVPQTISIAAGAVLITLVDYRVEIAVMIVVMLAAAAYMLTRRDERKAESALA